MHDLAHFRPVWGASGVQGFFGEGYWYQALLKRWVPGYASAFEHITLVAKTSTAESNIGNMGLNDDFTPKEKRPSCIIAGWWQILWGVMLNAVGLSNPSTGTLAVTGIWQELLDAFMISIMAIKESPEERLAEIRKITAVLQELAPRLRAAVGIQLNVSCPNITHRVARETFVRETLAFLDILSVLHMPVFVKINTLTNVGDMKIIAGHPACAGIIVSNTLPWAAVPRWMRILFFGSTTSPLAHLGGGGLSGWPLRGRVRTWIRAARKAGITTHLNAGGGIFGPVGVWRAWRAGADSISLGTIAAVRPWMLGITVAFATWLFTHFPRQPQPKGAQIYA